LRAATKRINLQPWYPCHSRTAAREMLMSHADSHPAFAGSIPQFYERYMVPLVFAPYAADLAARTAQSRPMKVLEIAAGTGAVTRQLAQVLPPDATIVATDLNPAMLDHAASIGTGRVVQWQPADGQHLPFEDGAFDAVVCQFGVMFFPEKSRAFAEARRVLRPGGRLHFNVWDHIEHNAFAHSVTDALALEFPLDPPRFMAQTPHGYHDVSVIARDLASGGWTTHAQIDTLAHRSRADTAREVAIAYCQGTPIRNEIEARTPQGLQDITERTAHALARQYGEGAVDGKIQAHVVTITR
jgi:SAM-dependent methyltransferase